MPMLTASTRRLRRLGIDGVSSTEGGFVHIVVLFILLVIIGAGLGVAGGG